ncbi:MAG: hypothetical protein JSU00_13785 [Acidobacteria bacterium]|nr:hypothetical protein [Acidobacteriota bacterium]
MQVKPILQPNAGERVAGSSPLLASRVEDWNRRLNLFSGRTLSDLALTAEQEGRAGRLALRGQAFSPGIVSGLEVAKSGPLSITLSAGLGFTASGEEIYLPTPAAINLNEARVVLNGVLDDTLGNFIKAAKPLPSAAILVLQPVTVQAIGNPDPADPCEADPSSDPFDDQQLVDACRLLLVAWPATLGPIPAHRKVWRNRLAWTLFNTEEALAADQPPVWAESGLPIALAGFDPATGGGLTLSFLDRHAVARDGGKPRRRIGKLGPSILWQARLQQFEAQLFEQSAPSEILSQQFVRIPPAGVLPRDAVDLQTGPGIGSRVGATNFFPGAYRIHAAPVALEQLDAVIQASAGLAPYHLVKADEVNLLVPVPQQWFEPDLLDIEQPSPEFAEELARSRQIRGIWLSRRGAVRAAASALAAGVTGTALSFPDPDPDAVDSPENPANTQTDTTLGIAEFATAEDTFTVANGIPGPLAALRQELLQMPGVQNEQVNTLPLDDLIARLERRANNTDNRIDLGYLRAQTGIYRIRQLILDKSTATRLAASPVLAEIAQGASAIATRDNLLNYVAGKSTQQTPANVTAPADIVKGSPKRTQPGDVSVPSGRGRQAELLAVRDFSPISFDIASTPVDATLFAKKSSSAERTLAQLASPPQQVQQQAPVSGAVTDVRTLSVAKRLDISPSIEARNYAVADKYQAITAFLTPDQTETVSVADFKIPGFRVERDDVTLNFDPKVITNDRLIQLLNGDHDAPPDNADEGGFFSAAIRAMEHSVHIYTLVESRIRTYRRAIERCRDVRQDLLDLLAAARKRLQAIDNELAETRHDITVAKALFAEEQARVDSVNARRDTIIATTVTFLAYHRPRFASLSPIDDESWIPPARSLDPGDTAAVIPACFDEESEEPDELRTMVNLLRDAPVRWFSEPPVLLDRIDRIQHLSAVITHARNRASFQLALPAPQVAVRAGALQPAISSILGAHADIATQARIATANLDLAAATAGAWTDLRARAPEIVSLGDLIDFPDIRAEVNRLAASSLKDIHGVASCLYAHFAAVQPAVRLAWAEGLSQFDGPVDLRQLTNLPRWNEVPHLDAKHLQAMADWLFQRIHTNQTDALTFFNSLIRVCVLLASHSPVNQLVNGALARPAPVVPGGILQVNVDHLQVAVGMAAILYQGTEVVGRAVVDNVGTGQAAVRIVTAAARNVTLTQGARVQFAAAKAFA